MTLSCVCKHCFQTFGGSRKSLGSLQRLVWVSHWHCWCGWEAPSAWWMPELSHPCRTLGCSRAAVTQAAFSKWETAWSYGSDTQMNSFPLFFPKDVEKRELLWSCWKLQSCLQFKGSEAHSRRGTFAAVSDRDGCWACVCLTPLHRHCLLWALPLQVPLSCWCTRQLRPTVSLQSLAHSSESSPSL